METVYVNKVNWQKKEEGAKLVADEKHLGFDSKYWIDIYSRMESLGFMTIFAVFIVWFVLQCLDDWLVECDSISAKKFR